MTLYVYDPSSIREATEAEIIARAQSILLQRFTAGVSVKSPDGAKQYLKLRLGTLQHEVFGVIHLNTHRCLIAAEDLFRGTLDSAAVHPREVLRSVMQHNSSSVILYHNHPSGIAEPSRDDELITRKLTDALAHIDVKVLDHFIVGSEIFSFAENDLI